MRKFLALMTISLAPAVACAEFYSGNQLYAQMTNRDSFDRLAALAYVAGAADAVTGVLSCPPAGVSVGQVYDLTKQLLEAMPESRHRSADSFVQAVMKANWPCRASRGT